MSHHDAQEPIARYPLTYYTPRAQAIYEQCPWDREHVEALYPILKGRLAADGFWHDIPNESALPWAGRFRVAGGYFQAVYTATKTGEPSAVFDQLAAMEPVPADDDAEWALWQRDEPDEGSVWYAVSSTFATTPGPFAHQRAVDDWLERHGLSLEPNERFVEGVAYFETIEPGCLGDAMQRLHWLEGVFADLNQHLENTGAAFWERLKAHSDGLLAQQEPQAREADEIVPLPERTEGSRGSKRRVPVVPSP